MTITRNMATAGTASLASIMLGLFLAGQAQAAAPKAYDKCDSRNRNTTVSCCEATLRKVTQNDARKRLWADQNRGSCRTSAVVVCKSGKGPKKSIGPLTHAVAPTKKPVLCVVVADPLKHYDFFDFKQGGNNNDGGRNDGGRQGGGQQTSNPNKP